MAFEFPNFLPDNSPVQMFIVELMIETVTMVVDRILVGSFRQTKR